MTLRTYRITPDAASGAPAGNYVSADDAAKLEETLNSLIWGVLYGKPIDGSRRAVQAEQVLADLRAGNAAAA
ncbi:hypothetical protein [Methyloversatilis sp.]|uniref:hypothetical protein n=1 Tax=Methyloversatilis sp. TaxID=2569862 RepID=UPI0035AE0335